MYSSCLVLATIASVIRLRSRRKKMEWGDVLWSSLYTGFSAMVISIYLAAWYKIPAPLVYASAMAGGLFNGKAYNMFLENLPRILRLLLTAMPEQPKGKSDGPGLDRHDPADPGGK